jgi:LacI family transcriptional regulator
VLLASNPSASLDGLVDAGIPIVLLDQPSPGLPLSSICVDYRAAAYDATKYLIAGGHRRVGFVGGTAGLPSADARHEGWRAAIEEAGLEPGLALRIPFTREDGYRYGLEMLSDTDVTAAFISSDQQAVGFLRAARQLGVSVPDSFWVMAFDDTDDCLYTNPTLSTVRQPLDDIVRRAIELLLAPPSELSHATLGHELVLRLSTGVSGNDERRSAPGLASLAESARAETSTLRP